MTRLAAGLIDRSLPLKFTFNGKQYQGFAGDTLASALLANGVQMVGRSFKYHRPRGVFSAGSEEPNALVELRDGTRQEPKGPKAPWPGTRPRAQRSYGPTGSPWGSPWGPGGAPGGPRGHHPSH